MVARGREEAQGSNSLGEVRERSEAIILVARSRAEVAGVGHGAPATVKATVVAGARGRGREREGGAVWSSQTGSGRINLLGLTRGPRV